MGKSRGKDFLEGNLMGRDRNPYFSFFPGSLRNSFISFHALEKPNLSLSGPGSQVPEDTHIRQRLPTDESPRSSLLTKKEKRK